MDKLREEFAAWCESKKFVQGNIQYVSDLTIRFCWEAWRASRAALVFDLPDVDGNYTCGFSEGGDIDRYARDVISAIKSTGISIKGDER